MQFGWLVTCGSFCISAAFAQAPEFRPSSTYDESSNALIYELRESSEREVRKSPSPKVKMAYRRNANQLLAMVKAKQFIDNDNLLGNADSVFKRIINANTLSRKPNRLLIMRNAQPNAFCFNEGTFALTTGMLALLKTEGELAYALCHELAHYELDHGRQRITENAERNTSRKISSKVNKMLLNDRAVTTKDMDSLKSWVYEQGSHNRSEEFEADSVGLLLHAKAGYDSREAFAMLFKLDSAKYPSKGLGPRLFDPFQSNKFPFDDRWLKPRHSLYNRRPSFLFFEDDSISSHPDLKRRLAAIQRAPAYASTKPSFTPLPNRGVFSFETIEAAIREKSYDVALFLCLQNWPDRPNDTYLVTNIAKLLIDLYESGKVINMFNLYVATYTGHYHDQQRMVTDFLHTIPREDMGNLAFDFLNRKPNFREDNREHYYLLWKISHLTGRKKVQSNVKKAYVKKFGRTGYYWSMFRTESPKELARRAMRRKL